MAHLINIKTVRDGRGDISIIEKELPFEIKRVFYIYNVPGDKKRGGHRHHKNIQALICVNGSCVVSADNGSKQEDFLLDAPEKCLILEPEDWHTMSGFAPGTVLLVLASEYYDPADYISGGYR